MDPPPNVSTPFDLFGYDTNHTSVRILYMLAYLSSTYLPYYEFLSCGICLLANGYSAVRFINAGTYSRNFRIVMIATNLVINATALLRPIYFLVPEETYYIASKNYFRMFVMYALEYISHVAILMFDVKYIIIGYERRVAFKNRATYENNQGKGTIMVFLFVLGAVSISAAIKAVLFIAVRDLPIDTALHKAFMMDADFVTWFASHFLALGGWIYGYYTFYDLNKQAHKLKYAGNSLSESFTLKEIVSVLKVIRPVIKAYIVILLSGVAVASFMCFFMLGGTMHEGDMYYRACITLEYSLAASYNIYASCYTIWYLKPLRKALQQDLTCCFRRKCVEIEPNAVEKYDAVQETNIYFEQLSKRWDIVLVKKR
ncbi:unnamed protein product [Bursaphelenchus okinawaensis]|uniref:G_PROTEIN_RECEP_F1_2 domain-containing protein n=1 Tax=Bursaphelenchus okinawaensis TaxID=465554 RepID=A0A811LS35_9BILA|nr:unnamed protein product [Bursaphelenchus okinawaensis]CAG9127588.1 unnamed protein product [Bursaphelenchus okinawaensis]